jgi:hypothetical protein
MSIERLNQGTVGLGSSIPFYDDINGRDARCSVADLAAMILAGLSSQGFAKQYAAPNTNGYAVTVTPPIAGTSVWLVVTPTGIFTNLTINLPAGSDGQEVLVSCTQAVTGALTVTGATVGAGAQPVNGAPATLGANSFFRLKFDSVSGSWYRVG